MARTPGKINLLAIDSNAYSILAAADRALRDVGVSKTERAEYYAQATSGDYDHLVRTTLEWLNVVSTTVFIDDEGDGGDDPELECPECGDLTHAQHAWCEACENEAYVA